MTQNPFLQWRAAGYQDLIPVVPPNAICDPKSHVGKSKGKSPGKRYPSGLWAGLTGWNTIKATEQDLIDWSEMGASVGLRFGDVWMLDLDIYDEHRAEEIEAEAIRHFGPAPLRIGLWPKRALLYRSDGTIRMQKVHFSGDDGLVNTIEIPPQGVVQGIHAKTGKPYDWRRPPGPFEELTLTTGQQVDAFMAAMKAKLPNANRTNAASDNEVAQASLRGKVEHVAQAVTNLPNTADMRWDYMIKVGYAIKAALPDDADIAFELWDQWCARWEGDGYDHEIQERRWETLKGPFRVGAGWLIDEVQRLTKPAGTEPGTFLAELNFEPIDDEESAPKDSLFDVSMEVQGATRAADVYPLLSLEDIMSREPPAFLVARHIPQVSVGFLYSTPGAGKSFLALDVALSLSCAFSEWNGDALTPADDETIVLYIAAEGSFGFRNRVKAWCQERGIKSLPKRFLMIERTIDFMSVEDIEKLLRTVRGVGRRPCLVIVDTVSRAMPGADENLQKEMTLFVRACDRLKEAFSCAVLGVHHAGKNGDMRGSTVLLGAGDYVFKLERKKGATIGNLYCEKQKDAPDGWTEPYRFDKVSIGEDQTSLIVSRADVSMAPDVALTPSTSNDVLRAMGAAWEAQEPWTMKAQAGERYAIRRMVNDFGFSATAAEEVLVLWEQTGVIETATASAKRRKIGFKVLAVPGQVVHNEGVFD